MVWLEHHLWLQPVVHWGMKVVIFVLLYPWCCACYLFVRKYSCSCLFLSLHVCYSVLENMYFLVLVGFFFSAVDCPAPLKNRDLVNQRSWRVTEDEYIVFNHSVAHEVRICNPVVTTACIDTPTVRYCSLLHELITLYGIWYCHFLIEIPSKKELH